MSSCTGLAVTVHYFTGTPTGPRTAESRTSPLRVHAARWCDLSCLIAAGQPAAPAAYLLTGPAQSGAPALAVRLILAR